MGPGCTYLRGTKNYYTSSGWEPPSPNWSSRLLLKREVNSAVSVATSDASLGLRGRGPSPSCLAGRLRAGANSAVPSVRGVAPDSPSSQPITKTRDPKQVTAAKSPSWESGDLGLSLAQPWAGSPRGVLLPLDLGLPRCTVGLSWTVPLDPRSRRSARTKPQTSAAGKNGTDFWGCRDWERRRRWEEARGPRGQAWLLSGKPSAVRDDGQTQSKESEVVSLSIYK